MDTYQIHHENPAEFQNICTLDDLNGMADFYLSTVRESAADVLDSFSQEIVFQKHYIHDTWAEPWSSVEFLKRDEPLSQAEETRLMRAIYRFQLWCNLYGMVPNEPCSSGHKIEPWDILTDFFDVFQTWEGEKIACINHAYGKMYKKCLKADHFHLPRPHWDGNFMIEYAPPLDEATCKGPENPLQWRKFYAKLSYNRQETTQVPVEVS